MSDHPFPRGTRTILGGVPKASSAKPIWRSAFLALGLLGTGRLEAEDTAPQTRYFYVSSVSAVFRDCYTEVLEARSRKFDAARIRAQYSEAIRHHFPTDPFRYLHNADVHGPFATRKEAENNRAGHMGRSRTHTLMAGPREPFRFTYSDTVILGLWPPGKPDKTGEDLGTQSGPISKTVDTALAKLNVAQFPRGLSPKRLESLQQTVKALKPDMILVSGDLIDPVADCQALAEHLATLIREPAAGEAHVLIVVGADSRDVGTKLIGAIKAKAPVVADRISIFSARPQTGGDAADVQAPAAQLRDRVRTLLNMPAPPVRLNELMPKNEATLADEAGEFDDWVEIINTGTQPFDVGGMYLGDNSTRPARWRIPQDRPAVTMIAPGGVLLIWCDKQPAQGPLHADFKLSSAGEQLLLVDTDGRTALDHVSYPALPRDRSYGRPPGGAGDWRVLDRPTPGRP